MREYRCIKVAPPKVNQSSQSGLELISSILSSAVRFSMYHCRNSLQTAGSIGDDQRTLEEYKLGIIKFIRNNWHNLKYLISKWNHIQDGRGTISPRWHTDKEKYHIVCCPRGVGRLSHLRRGPHARVGVAPFFPGDKTWGGGASSAAWLASDRKKSLNMSDGKNWSQKGTSYSWPQFLQARSQPLALLQLLTDQKNTIHKSYLRQTGGKNLLIGSVL